MGADLGNLDAPCGHAIQASLTQRIHGDAGSKVEVLLARCIVHTRPFAVHKHNVRPHIGLQDVPMETEAGRAGAWVSGYSRRGRVALAAADKEAGKLAPRKLHTLLLILNDLLGQLRSIVLSGGSHSRGAQGGRAALQQRRRKHCDRLPCQSCLINIGQNPSMQCDSSQVLVSLL